MSAPRCTGEPISWLRLEQLALGVEDRAALAHLEACPACAAARARLVEDVRPLPELAPAAPAGRAWWRWWGQAAGLAAALALALLWLFVRTPDELGDEVGARPAGARAVRVKGAGLVEVTLVRERDGLVSFDPAGVRDRDRWKVQLTCDRGEVWIDVAVIAAGAADFPLPAQRLPCGNAVAVPGAFHVTGGSARVCIALDAAPPDRAAWQTWQRRGRCVALVAE